MMAHEPRSTQSVSQSRTEIVLAHCQRTYTHNYRSRLFKILACSLLATSMGVDGRRYQSLSQPQGPTTRLGPACFFHFKSLLRPTCLFPSHYQPNNSSKRRRTEALPHTQAHPLISGQLAVLARLPATQRRRYNFLRLLSITDCPEYRLFLAAATSCLPWFGCAINIPVLHLV
jgi:hypothetical protein